MYEPSKITTTKSALPIAPRFPTFLTPVLDPSPSSASDDPSEDLALTVTGLRLELPKKSRSNATRETLQAENEELRSLMEKCVEGMSEMYVHMKLMDIENANLRKRAFERTTKKKAVYFEGARLMTSLEMLDALARSRWGALMKDVLKEMQPRFKEIKNRYKAYEKKLEDMQKAADKQKAKEKKELERAEKKAEKAKLAAEEKERKRLERERIKEAKRLEKEGAVAQISVGRRRGQGRGRGRGARGCGRGRGRGGGGPSISISDDGEKFDLESADDADTDSSSSSSSITPIAAVPCPKPRPKPVLQKTNTNSVPKQLSGNDSDVPEDECIIASILGHQWSWGVLVFEVAWEDGDVTWQNLESVDDCLALDVYLQKRGVERPQDLV
ncbi:hypothetical protein D9758_014509 [Tetrapyrgos nigripes]|uniref:Chromo domain-containing protein n=1 Tax=Tetrapyrgos nigripes TaxID=182062 RepID=A0A8H5FSY2_9AGAR|nr:hypothetical protein D9758_014509 [Tetrapyrgos nigripes]